MKIKYVNHNGIELDLSGFPYLLQTSDAFDFEWSYKLSEIGLRGSRVTSFYRNSKEIELNLVIHSNNVKEAMEHFFEVTEVDVTANMAGRLVLGDGEYLSCFIVASKHDRINPKIMINERKITLVSPYPFWVKEVFKRFHPGESVITPDMFKYDYNYEYNYCGTSRTQGEIVNDNVDGADFNMKFYGPCRNPYVEIGDHLYQVRINVPSGSYIEIDSMKKTVSLVDSYGNIENAFAYRSIQDYIFEKIPMGTSIIRWAGNYAIDVTVYQRRSEPKWMY